MYDLNLYIISNRPSTGDGDMFCSTSFICCFYALKLSA